jgi:hypothetical protein
MVCFSPEIYMPGDQKSPTEILYIVYSTHMLSVYHALIVAARNIDIADYK